MSEAVNMAPEVELASVAAVRIEDVTVRYRHERDGSTTLKELLSRGLGSWSRRQVTTALEAVSLVVRPGEVFGIIGRNGAGKSTLLKVIAGIMRPSEGRVQVWGKMAPLLTLGAGSHRELTGYENIFLYSALLGRSRADTEQRLDDIIAFAEIGDFVRSPLREYSSGMVARLAFAVAMAERPDLLLVDEVLGVGDEQFREKCHHRFREFQTAGTSTIIVTHQINYVEQSCDRAAWLAGGQLQSYGQAADVVADYRRQRRASLA